MKLVNLNDSLITVKIALCAAVCVETMGAGCIACMGSQYVDCIDCLRVNNELKITKEVEQRHLTTLKPSCCQYKDLHCYDTGKCEIASQEMMKANKCTDICVPGSCGWVTMLKCSGMFEITNRANESTYYISIQVRKVV